MRYAKNTSGASLLDREEYSLWKRYVAEPHVQRRIAVRNIRDDNIELVQTDVPRSKSFVVQSGGRGAELNQQRSRYRVLLPNYSPRIDCRRHIAETNPIDGDRIPWLRRTERYPLDQTGLPDESPVRELRDQILRGSDLEG